jgi:pimeloyl-ACP methyl ester carboxylesterase
MPTARCQGLDLFYSDVGSGDPVVFLNGLAGDHLYWNSQVRTLSPRFRCLSLDNRDVGQSAYSEDPYTVVELAADVAAFLDTVGVSAAHVVGLSLGGMTAQELALRYPHRVRSLVLSNTLGRCDEWFSHFLDAFCLIRRQVPDTPRFFEAVLPWLVSHRFFDQPGAAEWLKALFYRNPYPQKAEGFYRQIEAIRTHNALDRLGSCSIHERIRSHEKVPRGKCGGCPGQCPWAPGPRPGTG